MRVPRERWLGFRWAGHGFGGPGVLRDVLDDVLLLGVQDSRGDGAAQGLAVRGGDTAIPPGGRLTAVWSVRGAPHVHRADRLDIARAAFAPGDEPEPGVTEVAAALTAVVTETMTKCAASAAVSARTPDLVQWCARCRSDHVPDGTFRAAGRHAGLAVSAGLRGAVVLHPRPDVPQEPDDRSRDTVLDAFLRVNGPTTRAQVRDWAGWTAPVTAHQWTAREMVRVDVDGHRMDLPADLVDALAGAAPAEGAVLVPPHDGYLRHADRAVLVPDRDRRAQVWRAVSAPGALLVDGEVAGTWRLRHTEGELTITPFGPVPEGRRAATEESARQVGGAVGIEDVTICWDR